MAAAILCITFDQFTLARSSKIYYLEVPRTFSKYWFLAEWRTYKVKIYTQRNFLDIITWDIIFEFLMDLLKQ